MSQFGNDVEQLKEWVDWYYVIGEKDAHYEHLVVNHFLIRDAYYTYCFAETEGDIVDGDFGIVQYAARKNGQKNDSSISNCIVQQFVSYKQVKKKEKLVQKLLLENLER